MLYENPVKLGARTCCDMILTSFLHFNAAQEHISSVQCKAPVNWTGQTLISSPNPRRPCLLLKQLILLSVSKQGTISIWRCGLDIPIIKKRQSHDCLISIMEIFILKWGPVLFSVRLGLQQHWQPFCLVDHTDFLTGFPPKTVHECSCCNCIILWLIPWWYLNELDFVFDRFLRKLCVILHSEGVSECILQTKSPIVLLCKRVSHCKG